MSLSGTIKHWVVNDYFTPNIKAEVILDTLLTPYISQILKNQLDIDAELLTKEMSIQDKNGSDNRGAKIDYVLEGKDTVYLVELKTTKGSINADKAKLYTQNCCDGGRAKTFGPVLGEKLLTILKSSFKKQSLWTVETLQKTIRDNKCEDRARCYLKRTGSASTRKYLYTIGQILDHCADLGALWKKELRLIYLTPDGGNVFPNKPTKMNKQNQTEAEQEWKELMSGWGALYRGPQSLQDPKGVNSSISLREAVQKLQPEPGDEEFVALLQSIVKSIYDTEEILPCQT